MYVVVVVDELGCLHLLSEFVPTNSQYSAFCFCTEIQGYIYYQIRDIMGGEIRDFKKGEETSGYNKRGRGKRGKEGKKEGKHR